MRLLHYLSYVATLAAFVFVTLSLASGLLYVSELIEEHSRLAKLIGQRTTYTVIALHVLLYVHDSLPLLQTTFSVISHIVYLQNFSACWPLISLSSASFVASCAMAIINHFLWFIYFSRLARDDRRTYRHRAPVTNTLGFTDVATFFGICVWLVPLFLFLSLSANDNALPISSGNIPDPSSTPARAQRSKSSLFKSMFSLFSKDRTLALGKPDGLITPPPSTSAAIYPLPSPSTSSFHSPFPSPPPRSPQHSTHNPHLEVHHTSLQQTRCPNHPLEQFISLTDRGASLPSRRNPSSGRDRSADD